jgi:hypothetical protein
VGAAFGFFGCSLRTTNSTFLFPRESRALRLIDQWKQTDIANPKSFSFDPSNVANELAAISDVKNEWVASSCWARARGCGNRGGEYRKPEKAGIDSVIEE